MVVIATKHSQFSFDLNNDGSVLDLPFGLQNQVVDEQGSMVYFDSPIPIGVYRILPQSHLILSKIRGEIIIEKNKYHYETIYAIIGGIKYPYVFKLWHINRCFGYEFLINSSIQILRQNLLGLSITNNPLTHEILGYFEECSDSAINRVHSALNLIPNLTTDEYSFLFQNERYSEDIRIRENEFLSNFYFQDLTTKNAQYLMHILFGDIPIHCVDHFVHQGSFLDTHRSSILYNNHQYFGIMKLALIPFDHFVFSVNFQASEEIEIMELDSMSGIYFPHIPQEILHREIIAIIHEFFQYFFQIKGTHDHYYYVDQLDFDAIKIDKIIVKRYMDESIHIILFSGDMIYEKTFDLVMLDILSPAIGF